MMGSERICKTGGEGKIFFFKRGHMNVWMDGNLFCHFGEIL